MHDKYLLAVFLVGTIIIVMFAITIAVFLIIHKQRHAANSLREQQMENEYRQNLLQTRIEETKTQ